MNKEAKILIGIAGVVLIGGILLAIFANPQPEAPSAPVDEQSLLRENTHMTGSPDAKVTLVEFGDFQCPACAQAHPAVKAVLAEYEGNPDVNFAYRHFPLDTIHPNAQISAEAAEAAGEQGKFWEMHDILFERQAQWGTLPDALDTLVGYASELGLDIDKFKSSVSQRLYSDVIAADFNDGTAIGVNSTPTFFLNGVKLNGFNPEEVRTTIEGILSGQALPVESTDAMTGESGGDAQNGTAPRPTDVDQAAPPEQSIDQLPPEQQTQN